MPTQRTNHGRITPVFPDDFPRRLERFKNDSGLSWSELARSLGTRHTALEGGWSAARHAHMMALPDLGLGHPHIPQSGPQRDEGTDAPNRHGAAALRSHRRESVKRGETHP